MPSMSRTEIIGHVGQDPEMRFTPSGKPVTTFSVAVSSRYQKNEEWQEVTTWFNVVAWNKLAELCNERINKGSLVYIEGRIQLREWDKEGVKHSKLELIANTAIFLDRKPKEG